MSDRRCWRCLQMFPGEDAAAGPTDAGFWLCDACEGALLPTKHRGKRDRSEPTAP